MTGFQLKIFLGIKNSCGVCFSNPPVAIHHASTLILPRRLRGWITLNARTSLISGLEF
ncbi:MAG: hypothetical protein HZB17_00245 [Chloroflexi bacterium]|nr:hypothetical protein [Chloroflexota bacterium]